MFKEQFPKFDVKINRTHCILQATNVRMNVAGSYVCETISSSNERGVFLYELIMLGKLILETNAVYSTYIVNECSVVCPLYY